MIVLNLVMIILAIYSIQDFEMKLKKEHYSQKAAETMEKKAEENH